MEILVDADALPRDAMNTLQSYADKPGLRIIVVHSINHQLQLPAPIVDITVDAHSQSADMEIFRRIQREEPTLVVTQDYGLASLALGKGALALSPGGMAYTEGNIDRLLFERTLHAHERKRTGRNKGPKARTEQQAQAFAAALAEAVAQLEGFLDSPR